MTKYVDLQKTQLIHYYFRSLANTLFFPQFYFVVLTRKDDYSFIENEEFSLLECVVE